VILRQYCRDCWRRSPGTQFFVKGMDVPVAVPPDCKAASWFGGSKGPDWSAEKLLFALSKSNEGMNAVSFAEFARVIRESLKPASERNYGEDRSSKECNMTLQQAVEAFQKNFIEIGGREPDLLMVVRLSQLPASSIVD
jgi:hypothetical protein